MMFFLWDRGITDVSELEIKSSVWDFFQHYIDTDNGLLHHFKQTTKSNLSAQKKKQLKAAGKLTPSVG